MACSVFSPIQYVDYQIGTTMTFMSAIMVCMAIGYYFGANHQIRLAAGDSRSMLSNQFRNVVNLSFVSSAIVVTIILLITLMTKGISLNIFNSGESYVSLYDAYERNTASYGPTFILSTIAAPFLFMTQIWGLYFFPSLRRPQKLMVVFTLLTTFVVFTIGDGKQKQFGDMVVYIACIFALKRAAANRLNMKLLWRFLALGLAAGSVLLILLDSRYSAVGIDAANLGAVIHPLMVFQEDHWLMRLLGPNLGLPVAMLSSYFGQGYYGLSLALQEPFTWTHLAGGAYSISVIVNKLGGAFYVEQSYPYLVGDAFGWSESKWHTGYAWIASDLTWPGTALFTGLVSYVFAVAWKEAVLLRNPFSILVVCMLSIGAAYLPANNQLMHSPGSLLTLIIVFSLYFRYRGAVNYHSLNSLRRRMSRSSDMAVTA
jgi:hypothetical protein